MTRIRNATARALFVHYPGGVLRLEPGSEADVDYEAVAWPSGIEVVPPEEPGAVVAPPQRAASTGKAGDK